MTALKISPDALLSNNRDLSSGDMKEMALWSHSSF